MPIKSKVLIQIFQKSQDRHKISFAIGFNNKNTKKVFGANLPFPNTIKLDLTPDTIRVNCKKGKQWDPLASLSHFNTKQFGLYNKIAYKHVHCAFHKMMDLII